MLFSLTFDISTPPRLHGSVWSYVDLELDVWVEALTGSVQIEDEDEFVAACADGTISHPEAEAARLAAMRSGRSSVDVRGEFGVTGAARLFEAVAQGLDPIAVLP